MKRKFIALPLALILVLSACAGMGGAPAQEAAPTPQQQVPATPATPATPAAPADGIGSPDAPVPITILLRDPIAEEYAMSRAIEEGMARQGNFVTIEFLEPPAGNYNEVVPIALRTGTIDADIIWFQAGHLPLGQEGLFEDLTPYIANSYYVRSLLQPFNKQRLETFPYMLFLAPIRIQVPVIRTDWLNQLDAGSAILADPTVDNWLALMRELVSSGLADYAITIDGNMQRMDTIFNHAFGVTGSFMRDSDGNWISSMISDAERDKLAFYAQLFAEGLLDPEFITNDWQVMEQRFYSGEVGIIAGGAGPVTQIYNDRMVELHGPEAALTVLPPARGVGHALRSLDVTMEDRGLVINRDSPQHVKDAAFAMFEFMASPEGRMLDLVGIEGMNYEVVNGTIEITNIRMHPVFWHTIYNFDPGPFRDGFPFEGAFMDSLQLTQDFFYPDTNIILPPELMPIWDSLLSSYREFVVDVIRGLRPADDMDALREQWNAFGWPDVQAWLNENLQ